VEVVASLSQGRTAAAQCGLFPHKSVPVIFEPPCSFTNHVSWTYLPLWHVGRAGAKGHGALNLTGRGIQPSRSTSQTPADGTLPLKQKKKIFFLRIQNSLLSQSTQYVTLIQTKFWIITPCSLVSGYQHSQAACHRHILGRMRQYFPQLPNCTVWQPQYRS